MVGHLDYLTLVQNSKIPVLLIYESRNSVYFRDLHNKHQHLLPNCPNPHNFCHSYICMLWTPILIWTISLISQLFQRFVKLNFKDTCNQTEGRVEVYCIGCIWVRSVVGWSLHGSFILFGCREMLTPHCNSGNSLLLNGQNWGGKGRDWSPLASWTWPISSQYPSQESWGWDMKWRGPIAYPCSFPFRSGHSNQPGAPCWLPLSPSPSLPHSP